MEILNVLKEFPQSWLILISGIFGFFAKTIVDYFIGKSKKRIDLQELYWKEKIDSAKKASEYYLSHVSFFSLTADKYEIIEENRDGSENLIKDTEELIVGYQKRLLEFPHFEHYHVNLFYDFDESESTKLIKENYGYIQNIHSINPKANDEDSVFEKKWLLIRENFGNLKNNNRKLIQIYKGYLKIIRDDIKALPYK